MEKTMSDITVGEAFGIKTQKPIHLNKVCPMGGQTNVEADLEFKFKPEIVRRVLNQIRFQNPIWVWGPSGCGKTELLRQFAARLNRPCHVLSFGEETSLRELLGSYELQPSEEGVVTRYRHGSLVQAVTDPWAIVVLDELNMAPPGVTAQLNRLLEARYLKIPETGEHIEVAQGVVIAATANTAGGIDATGLYAGSQVQNGATRNRFVGLRITYLDPEDEAELIRKRIRTSDGRTIDDLITVGTKMATETMVDVANGVRSLIEEGRCSQPFSVRTLLNWGVSALANGSLAIGFQDAYLDLLDPVEATGVNELFKKFTGIDPQTGMPVGG